MYHERAIEHDSIFHQSEGEALTLSSTIRELLKQAPVARPEKTPIGRRMNSTVGSMIDTTNTLL